MKALAAYLEAHKILKSDFAKQIGVTPGRVSQLLNDASQMPSLDLIVRIEAATQGAITSQHWADHARGRAA